MKRHTVSWKGLIIPFLFALFNNSYSQTNWERLYGLPNRGERTYVVIKTYDNGFLYGILVQGQVPNQYGSWLLKTDINGFPIWSKNFFSNDFSFIITHIDEDESGDIIITGDTREFDIAGDPMIMRLNSCGEKIWCKYMHFPQSNFGWRVKHLLNGNYILLTWRASNTWIEEWIQLWKIDTSGNILFCNQIIPTYSYTNLLGPTSYDLYLTQDSGFLLSGYCYFPEDTTNPQGISCLQHLLIKTDSLGNEEWVIPDTLNLDHTGILNSALDQGSSYYIAGFTREEAPVWHPYLGRYSHTGQLLYEHTMHPDTLFTIIFGLREENDFFYQEGQCFYSNDMNEFTGVFKTDTMGILLKSLQNKNGSPNIGAFSNSIDNKYLISGYAPYDYTSFTQLDAWAMKVNENLEYDSLYSFPFVYDSLCPFPIPTDTVDCDCDLITGYGEPVPVAERYRVEIYPNPATEKVQIRLNDLVGNENREWKKVILFDLFGRRVMEKDFVTETSLEAGRLNAGIYLVVAEQDGLVLARGKLVVF
jgi:hypothetical protein